MQRVAFLLIACFACGGQPDAIPDAGIDARVVGLPRCGVNQIISCRDSTASVTFGFFNEQIPAHACDPPATTGGGTVVCTDGCAVELVLSSVYYGAEAVIEPADLCAETPAAQTGEPCGSAIFKCLPRRARLNPDGTVAGRDELTCGANNLCEAATFPVWVDYLTACDAAVVAAVAPGSYGALPGRFVAERRACLLAWDEASKTMHSGETLVCLGDWQCPELALCDAVPNLTPNSGSTLAVCKPGPRGMLTPAMLPN